MKKICLCAAIVPFLLNAQAEARETQSQPIELKLGGYMRWYGTFADFFKKNNLALLENQNVNKFDVMGDGEIYFQGRTRLDDGMEIGAMVQIKAGTEVKTFDESYLFVDGAFGRFQAGNVKNVDYQMSVNAPTVSFIGLQESSYNRFGVFGLLGKSAEATYATWDDISTKLNYISPNVSGFSLGVSLMPSNNSGGLDNTVFVNNTVFQYGGAVIGLYENRLNDDWLLTSSASYAFYKPRESYAGTHKAIRDFSAGMNVTYKDVTIGGSVKRELSPVNTFVVGENFSDTQGWVWDAGVSYDAAVYGLSLSYTGAQTRDTALNSARNRSDLIVAAAKYRLGAGINVFFDMSYAKVDKASGEKAQGIGSAAGFDVVF